MAVDTYKMILLKDWDIIRDNVKKGLKKTVFLTREEAEAFFVAIGASEYGGGLLRYDTYEQDYFGIGLSDSAAEQESRKRLERLKKSELIEAAHGCLKVLYAYLGLQNRYDNLKAAMDILKDENTGYLQVVKQIEELYEKVNEETDGFKWCYEKSLDDFDRLLKNMPQEAWIQ